MQGTSNLGAKLWGTKRGGKEINFYLHLAEGDVAELIIAIKDHSMHRLSHWRSNLNRDDIDAFTQAFYDHIYVGDTAFITFGLNDGSTLSMYRTKKEQLSLGLTTPDGEADISIVLRRTELFNLFHNWINSIW